MSDAGHCNESNGWLAIFTAGILGFEVVTDIPWTGVAIFATNGCAAVSGVPPAALVSPEVSMALKLAMIFKAGTFVVSPSFFHLREAWCEFWLSLLLTAGGAAESVHGNGLHEDEPAALLRNADNSVPLTVASSVFCFASAAAFSVATRACL